MLGHFQGPLNPGECLRLLKSLWSIRSHKVSWSLMECCEALKYNEVRWGPRKCLRVTSDPMKSLKIFPTLEKLLLQWRSKVFTSAVPTLRIPYRILDQKLTGLVQLGHLPGVGDVGCSCFTGFYQCQLRQQYLDVQSTDVGNMDFVMFVKFSHMKERHFSDFT